MNNGPEVLLGTQQQNQEQQQDQRQCHRVGLLQGPAQSGKTSLLLEAAVDLVGGNRIHDLSSLSWCACLSKHHHPQCVCATPVILFKRQIAKTQATSTATNFQSSYNNGDDNDHDEEEDFPLFVRPESTKHFGTTTNNNSMIEPKYEENWDPMALQRIQVHYYTSWNGLLHALWTLQGLPNQQRPCRAILVDDLVVRDHDSDDKGTVLADTADFMGIWALAAVEEDAKISTAKTNQQTMLSHFVSPVVQLVPPPPMATTTNNQNGDKTGRVVVDGKAAAEYRLTTEEVYEWKLLS
eukprot:scaffold289_cov147-Amphora_coffeaeformis.AAC.13